MLINYILVILISLLTGVTTLAQKKYSQLVCGRTQSTHLYSLGVSIVSMVLFYIMAGEAVHENKLAVIYGAISGGLNVANFVITFIGYRKMNLVMISVFGRGNIITSWIIGICFFKEPVKMTSILAVVLVLIAIIIPVFESKNKNQKKSSVEAYLVGILMIIIVGCNTFVLQSYYKHPQTDTQSASAMFFYTNVFLFFVMAGIFIYSSRKSNGGQGVKQELKTVNPICILLIVLTCIIGNPTNVLSAYVLKTMPLSIYTIFSAGVSSIVIYLMSRFIFKEKVSKLEMISLIIATAAAIVTVF